VLDALSPGAFDELVHSMFGDVDNRARLAKLLFEKSAGNPQHCMELARLLARQHVAKYVAGTWVLPTQVSSEELPDRLEDVFARAAGRARAREGRVPVPTRRFRLAARRRKRDRRAAARARA
jgi:predicted ATPase